MEVTRGFGTPYWTLKLEDQGVSYEKYDATHARFRVTVAPQSKQVFEYTVTMYRGIRAGDIVAAAVGWALAHADHFRRSRQEQHGLKPILQLTKESDKSTWPIFFGDVQMKATRATLIGLVVLLGAGRLRRGSSWWRCPSGRRR